MDALIIILLVLIFILIITKANKRKKSEQGNRQYGQSKSGSPKRNMKPPALLYDLTPLPDRLGIQPHLPLGPAVTRLEQALNGEFRLKLKERVLTRYPQMTEAEYEWKLLELKRYFLMTAVLKDVPMFSQAVDDLWHEMLMFTREYYQFGEALIGAPIHHGPHADGQPDPGGRAWFDWVYAQLFVPTLYSSRIWNPFFRHPLDPLLLNELRLGSEDELTAGRFNKAAVERFPEIRETVRLLIRKAKDQAAGAVPGAAYTAERPAYESAAYMPYLAGALMFYSATEFADFDSAMEPHYAEEEAKRRAQEAGTTSSSCGSGCSSGSWHGDGNNRKSGSDGDGSGGDGGSSSGGNDSGGSSSSSSCSSCGGGGD
ncbi:MAG: hypothetical protein K0S39_4275 [Paenibacillus sp.]|jgi:uncharacterized membrane protein YgcG|nr:hypothetical protein [Paenibacillus sp.]